MKDNFLLIFKVINWLWALFMVFMIFLTRYTVLYLNPKEEILTAVYFVFAFLALPSIIFLFWRYKIEAAAKLVEPPLNIDKYLINRNEDISK